MSLARGLARPCPRCTFPLEEHRHGRVVIDRCPRCAGSFLEDGEAAGVFGQGHDLDDLRMGAARVASSRLRCPLGHGALVAYQIGVHADHLEVDVCPRCRGLWLDAWEGVKLKRALSQGRAQPSVQLPEDEPAHASKTGVGWYLFQLFSGLPVEAWNPVRRRPWLVHGFLVLNVVAFVAEIALVQATGGAFLLAFGLVPRDFLALEQPWAAVTHMFLHAGIGHLLGNLWFLHVFGDNIEDTLGRKRFLQIFFLSGLLAAAAQIASNPTSSVPLIGASGAISGLMGAYLVLFPRVKVWVVWLFVRFRLGVVWYLVLWLALQTFLALADLQVPGRGEQGGVAFFAHIGGFVAGAALGLWWRREAARRG